MNRAFVYSLIAIVHFWVISQGQTPLIAQQAVPKAGPFEEKNTARDSRSGRESIAAGFVFATGDA